MWLGSWKRSTFSLAGDTWSAPLLHNSYIHKNVGECLSECCISCFENVFENYSISWNKTYHELLDLQRQCLSPEGRHSPDTLWCLSAKRTNSPQSSFSQLPTLVHFHMQDIYFFTSGFLASMYSCSAAEDSIHGIITDVKMKVLNCIMVSWREKRALSARLSSEVHVSRKSFHPVFIRLPVRKGNRL